MKKQFALLMASCLIFSCFASCGGDKGGKSDGNGVKFEAVLSQQEKRVLDADEGTVYEVNEDISGKDYVKLSLKTDVQLVGQFIYENVKDASEKAEEDFFIEASDGEKTVEFTQFLDRFRENGIGQYDKILKGIRLTNKSGKTGEVTLCSFSVSDRKIPEFEREIYLEKDEMKLGADLTFGGTLTYLSRTSYGGASIDEVINNDGNVYIGVNAQENCKQYLSSEVNLVNIWDAGRQIQQSYYADVGGGMGTPGNMQETLNYGANGYNRAWCFTGHEDGYWWPYNPVQAGDCADNPSQIIDYQITDKNGDGVNDEIYVKVRAMDWAKGYMVKYHNAKGTIIGGSTTKSYMENWYTIENGMVRVKNRFIDWNGFSDMHTVPVHTNELPATFVVHPFNNFVTYTGTGIWKNDTKNLVRKNDISGVTSGGGFTATPTEGWYAWLNDEDFGFGMYIPNINYLSTSRSHTSTSASININNCKEKPGPIVANNLFNKPAPSSDYTSCYAFNLSYTAPVVTWTMREYTPMSYEYAISVDYLAVMREQFKEIYESGTMTNETLSAWQL